MKFDELVFKTKLLCYSFLIKREWQQFSYSKITIWYCNQYHQRLCLEHYRYSKHRKNNIVFFRQYLIHKRAFPNFSTLVETILEIDDESVNDVEMTLSPSARNTVSPTNELQELEESRKCKACYREDARVVFIPCGHLACCVSCSEQVARCPVCKMMIKEKVTSYLS